jgi:hypothetical protein
MEKYSELISSVALAVIFTAIIIGLARYWWYLKKQHDRLEELEGNQGIGKVD